MALDEIVITKLIINSYMRDLIDATDVDVVIAGSGPSGLTAAKYLAEGGAKTIIFERKLSTGGGCHGGGMMFNKIVLHMEGKFILDDFGIKSEEVEGGYFVADSLETSAKLTAGAIDAGAKIFNLISVEDVMIREADKITGVVINWTAVEMANLHVDPMTIRCKYVVDATGHDAEICNVVQRKIPGARLETETGKIIGEKPMWTEVAERMLIETSKEVYPGLFVAGMAANAVAGGPRMGPIFSGMLISGRKVALDILKKLGKSS
ncbi:MAG: sulfide-dependent adenosine diphosphate thiazole synthase [Candidatus Lokiarchaeia archaeon]